ncbi:histone deacetylase [Kitasatospora sp. NPDC059327]|uniref:histone deacetylase n=1 Tax=Kitasatospora sp. NPDC059327 TaxID=3346803 RepID=UPI0036D0DF98
MRRAAGLLPPRRTAAGRRPDVPRLPGRAAARAGRAPAAARAAVLRPGVDGLGRRHGLLRPDRTGEVPARAYLVSAGQFSDIAAQETHREPGADLPPAAVLRDGRDRPAPGPYGTLVCPGSLGDIPVLTFTAPGGLADAEPRAPRAGYPRTVAAGLVEAHGWDLRRAAEYLGTRPGAAPGWTRETLLRALTDAVDEPWAAPAGTA